MKLKINGVELTEAIKKLKKLDFKNATTEYKNVQNSFIIEAYDNIIIKACNGSIDNIDNINKLIEVRITLNGVIEEPGSAILTPAIITAIENFNKDEVEITDTNIKYKNTIINYNKLDFKIIEFNNTNFNSKLFELKESDFLDLIQNTFYAIAKNEIRPILTGVLFELKNNKLNLVALDGFRMALTEKEFENNTNIANIIFSSNLVKYLKKIFKKKSNYNIEVYLSTENIVKLKFHNIEIISKLLEGEFIKYTSIIPQEYKIKFLLNSNDLKEKLKKFKDEEFVTLKLIENNLILSSENFLLTLNDKLSIKIVDSTINNLEVNYNANFLLDVLKKYKNEEEIIMELSSAVAPCVVKNKEETTLDLIMPIQKNRGDK